MRTNLYKEIIEILNENNRKLEDILYVSVRGIPYKPEKFLEIAKYINYDSGFGSAEIDESLEIVLKDGAFMIRREYNGAEWFDLFEPRELNVNLNDFPEDLEILKC